MKYLLMLEGKSEKVFIEVLIEKGLLKINKKDILNEMPFLKRQIDGMIVALIRQLPSDEKVKVLRIGDKMSDKLKKFLGISQKR